MRIPATLAGAMVTLFLWQADLLNALVGLALCLEMLYDFPALSKKIPISGVQTPLQSPFAALEPSVFPDASPASIPNSPATTAKRHRVVLRREKAQRGGKTVVVISQIPTHLSPPEIENLLKKAKKSLGCGGALAGREVELQGDQPDRVRHFLEAQGFDVAGP